MTLIIILMFIIGVSIGQIILSQKMAHAVTSINLGSITTGTVLGTPTFIGVKLSGTCIAMVKLNQTDDCPSYKMIFPFDNTNQQISGKFVTTNGFFHRLTSHTQFHYQMYKTEDTIIMIDPDAAAMQYGKTITIVPPEFTYKLNSDNATNGTRTQYYDRYVSSDCKQATISYSASLLNDTIVYLKNNCVGKSSFVEKKQIPLPVHKLDYNTAISKYYAWLKEAKKESSKNCITQKCIIPDTRWKK
jgi:hypothetical protein